MASIALTEYTDPGCPWAYSASPALAVLRWRYRDQLRWRIVTIGLTEDPQRYIDAGYTPARMAAGVPQLPPLRDALRAGAEAPRRGHLARLPGDRRDAPARPRARARRAARAAVRVVHDRRCSSTRTRTSAAPCRCSPGSTWRPSSARSTSPPRRRPTSRTAARPARPRAAPPTIQGKARQTDGPVRYSAPSLVLESEAGVRVEAGGFQPLEAYDVLIANLDRSLERQPPPATPLEALARVPLRAGHRRAGGDPGAEQHGPRPATRPSGRWSSCWPRARSAARRSATTPSGSRVP